MHLTMRQIIIQWAIIAYCLLAARLSAGYTVAEGPAVSRPLVRPTAAVPSDSTVQRGYTKEALADKVTELPGWQEKIDWLYSGWVPCYVHVKALLCHSRS